MGTIGNSHRKLSLHILVCVCLVLLALVIRLPTIHQPINRDLAAYATIGARIGEGQLPYRDLFDHKQPLIYVPYFFLSILAPRSNEAIQLAAGIIAGIAGIIVFVFLGRLIGSARAAFAAALCILFGVSVLVEGTDLNTEHLLLLFAAAAVLAPLTFRAPASWAAIVGIGLLSGFAILAKFVGVLIVPAVFMALCATQGFHRRQLTRTGLLFSVGLFAPVLLTLGFYAISGGLPAFLYSNVIYNTLYVTQIPFSRIKLTFGGSAIAALLVLAFCVAAIRLYQSRGRDLLTWTLLLWLIGAMLGAKLGRRDYPHYFAPLLTPAICLCVLPLVFRDVRVSRFANAMPLILLGLLLVPFLRDNVRAIQSSPIDQAVGMFGTQAYVWAEQEEVGAWLREHSRTGDRLFVADAEPGFYWQSGLMPGTRFLYDYPVFIDPALEGELRRSLASDPPRFMVLPQSLKPDYLSNIFSLYHVASSFGSVQVLQRDP